MLSIVKIICWEGDRRSNVFNAREKKNKYEESKGCIWVREKSKE